MFFFFKFESILPTYANILWFRSVCRPGTFNDTGVCTECPTGTFREFYLDAAQCTDCILDAGDNRTTIGTGAQSNTECGKDISSLYSIKLILISED